MTVADRVEEAVHCRREGPQAHHVGVDQIDAHLDADEVGRSVSHSAGDVLVQQSAAAEPEVDQIHAAEGGCESRPSAGGTFSAGALTDRASVMEPHITLRADCEFERGVGSQCDKFGGFVVRQPDLDGLGSRRASPRSGWC